MNNQLRVLAVSALLLTTSASPFAQSAWETVDNVTPWRGRDIVADASGNFISLTIDNSSSATSSVLTAVRTSADHGATWQPVGFIAGYALDLTVAPDGALFASGNRTDTASGRAFVWQSLDHGATWTVLDPSIGLPSPMLALDIATGNSSAIYVCGYSGANSMVRKGQRTDSGIMWTTADMFPGLQADSICVQPGTGGGDEVLVCGSAGGRWTVRRSVDSGATWASVDSYSTSMQRGYSGVAAGLDNSIYVVGRIATSVYVTNQTVVKKKIVVTVTSSTEYGWLVRKSADGGTTWSNVDYFANGWPGNGPIAVDGAGRVFIVGADNNPGSVGAHWVVRGSVDGGASWITTDLFAPSGSTRSSAQAVASDALGNICVIGETTDGSGNPFTAIRRLAAP